MCDIYQKGTQQIISQGFSGIVPSGTPQGAVSFFLPNPTPGKKWLVLSVSCFTIASASFNNQLPGGLWVVPANINGVADTETQSGGTGTQIDLGSRSLYIGPTQFELTDFNPGDRHVELVASHFPFMLDAANKIAYIVSAAAAASGTVFNGIISASIIEVCE